MGTDLGIAASKVIDHWLVFLYAVWLEADESHRANCVFLYPGCIQGWPLFYFYVNCITDGFGSIWKRKRNPMKPWKALQTASKHSLVSSLGSRTFRSWIKCTVLSKSFLWSWKKLSTSLRDGWKAGCVCINPYECIRHWLIGSSQVHLCWLSKGESNWVEEKTWRLQGQIWPTSYYRYPNRARSGLCIWYSLSELTDLWFVSATMAKNVETAANKKELDDLVSALGENRLLLRKPCMQGTRTAILQEIENDIKKVNGHSVIWIRGSPGVGKSALAASIAAQLRKQGRHVVLWEG